MVANNVGFNPYAVNANPYLYNNVNCNYPAITGEIDTRSQYDTAEFSNQLQDGESSKKESKTSKPLFWVTLTALAAVAILKRGKIAELIKKFSGKTENIVSKAVPKKSEVDIIQNIDGKYANSKSRKLLEKCQNNIVTPQHQAAYDKSVAYVAPTKQEAKAIEQLHKTNANQRAAVNTVENTAKGGKNLTAVKKSIEKAPALKEGINIGKNGDLLTVKNGKVVHIRTKTDGRVITDELKIAKHINKHQVI